MAHGALALELMFNSLPPLGTGGGDYLPCGWYLAFEKYDFLIRKFRPYHSVLFFQLLSPPGWWMPLA